MSDVKPFLLAKLTWQEAEALLKESAMAIVPVGSTEQHGPALPLDNDAYQANQLALAVADRLWPKVKTVVLPLVSYGVSPHHMPFAGTITLRPETLINLIVDIGMSLAKHGVKRILIMNSHGGNIPALSLAVRKLHEAGLRCVQVSWWQVVSDLVKETFHPPYFHADDMETSVAWALGQRVLEDRRVNVDGRELVPGFSKMDMFAAPPRISPAFDMDEITSTGSVGHAKEANREKGAKIVAAVVDRIAAFAELFASTPLPSRAS